SEPQAASSAVAATAAARTETVDTVDAAKIGDEADAVRARTAPVGWLLIWWLPSFLLCLEPDIVPSANGSKVTFTLH
ncbi:hypothetical protein, partial [Cupriavidus basilensis]|uniref:hypothetical protein n=1 Tax=Cupriavidus basilensis TaxID=68895 RepID=UPI0023E85B1A